MTDNNINKPIPAEIIKWIDDYAAKEREGKDLHYGGYVAAAHALYHKLTSSPVAQDKIVRWVKAVDKMPDRLIDAQYFAKIKKSYTEKEYWVLIRPIPDEPLYWNCRGQDYSGDCASDEIIEFLEESEAPAASPVIEEKPEGGFLTRMFQAQYGSREMSKLIDEHIEEYFKRWPSYKEKLTYLEWYHLFLDFSDKLEDSHKAPSPVIEGEEQYEKWLNEPGLKKPAEQKGEIPEEIVIPREFMKWAIDEADRIWVAEGAIMEPGELALKVACSAYCKLTEEINDLRYKLHCADEMQKYLNQQLTETKASPVLGWSSISGKKFEPDEQIFVRRKDNRSKCVVNMIGIKLVDDYEAVWGYATDPDIEVLEEINLHSNGGEESPGQPIYGMDMAVPGSDKIAYMKITGAGAVQISKEEFDAHQEPKPRTNIYQRSSKDYYLHITVNSDLLPENDQTFRATLSEALIAAVYQQIGRWRNTGVTIEEFKP